MTESYIIPEFDENGNFLSDDVKARIVEMIKANAPTPAPTTDGPKVITISEGHPRWPETLVEPLPDDLPMGSYLVNDPPFMGYELSQKTPHGWLPIVFSKKIGYYYPNYTPGELRVVIERNNAPVEDVRFTGTIYVTEDSLRITFDMYEMSFTKNEVVKVTLEGPEYYLVGNNAVSHQFDWSGANGPDAVSHLLEVSLGGAYAGNEYISGLVVKVCPGRDQDSLTIGANFGLSKTPDLRLQDRMYAPPSERKEVTIPDPTYTSNETYTMSTLTIPEVEGVVWHSTHLGYVPTDNIVEPGEHQIDNAVHPELYVQAVPVRGYYVVNGEDNEKPRWSWGRAWNFRAGIPITMPAPTGVEATTQGNRSGWIMRFPDVPNARYYVSGGWDESGQQIKRVLSGDAFIAYGEVLYAEADMPYYVTNMVVGYVQPDGTVGMSGGM